MSSKSQAHAVKAADLLSDQPPDGAPLHNPLTAEDIAGIQAALQHSEIISDAIRRAHHVGLDVASRAAQHEMHQGVLARLHAMYAPKSTAHLES